MSTDFETLLRTTEPAIRSVDPAAIIARTDRRRRRRAYALGAGAAAGVLAASVLGWGAYARFAGPAPAAPQPVTADCVVSQRHSMPAGKALQDTRKQPAGPSNVIGPSSPRTVVRLTERAGGMFGLASSTDGRTFKQLDVVGGGRCGLTVLADGNYRYVIAPVSPDATTMTVDAGVTLTSWLQSADGTLFVLGVSTRPDFDSPPVAYWTTTDGSVVNSDGDDIRTVRRAGIQISVNVTKDTFSTVRTDDGAPDLWFKVNSKGPSTFIGPVTQSVLVVPADSRDASYRMYRLPNKVVSDALGEVRATEVIPISESRYAAIVISSPSGENAQSVAEIRWTTPDGKTHTWRADARVH